MLWGISLLPLAIIFPKYAKESYRVSGFKYLKKHIFMLSILIICELGIIHIVADHFKQGETASYNILNVILMLLNLSVWNMYKKTYAILRKKKLFHGDNTMDNKQI